MAYSVNKGVIKIPAVGDQCILHIAKCEVVESKFKNDDGTFKQEVRFAEANGNAIFIPRRTADRYLLRMGFGEGEGETAVVFYGDVDGHDLRFSRDPNADNPAKPYYNIELADDGPRKSLTTLAKAEIEKVRVAKKLPPDDGGSMGPYIPGLDDDPDDPGPTDPYADDDGMPPQKPLPKAATTLTAEHANKEGAINAAYARAYAFVLGVQGSAGTAESVQSGAATVLIQYAQSGMFR